MVVWFACLKRSICIIQRLRRPSLSIMTLYATFDHYFLLVPRQGGSGTTSSQPVNVYAKHRLAKLRIKTINNKKRTSALREIVPFGILYCSRQAKENAFVWANSIVKLNQIDQIYRFNQWNIVFPCASRMEFYLIYLILWRVQIRSDWEFCMFFIVMILYEGP